MVSFISFKVLHKPGLDRGSPILAQFQIEWSSGLADLLSCWSTALWIFEKNILYPFGHSLSHDTYTALAYVE